MLDSLADKDSQNDSDIQCLNLKLKLSFYVSSIIHLISSQSLNLRGCRGTTDDVATIPSTLP